MTERTWERYGAATGIAFGILLVASLFIAPQPPHIDASADKIIAYYRDNRTAVVTAGVVSAFAGVAAILFIAHLRHIFDRVENGIEGLSTVVFATGIATVAASIIGGVVQTTLAFMTVQPGEFLDGGLVRALYDVVYVSFGPTFLLLAAFLATVAVGMIRGEVATAPLGWFAAVVAAVSVAAGIGQLTVSSYSAGWTAVGLVAILGLAAWDVVAGATMMARPEAEAMGSHRSLIAPVH
jgi:hypothetical protein